MDVLVAPAFGYGLALEHLEEQVGAPACGVFFLTGDLVARAHRTAALAAPPDPEAALGCYNEAVSVCGELEVRLYLRRVVICAGAQVCVQRVGVYDLSRVHLALGVPDLLELAEGVDKLFPEHYGQELRPLALAVLASYRAAVADHQLRRLIQKRAELLEALSGFQVEGDAGVDATLAEVPVIDAVVAVLVQQLLEVPQVVPEYLRRNCRVLPGSFGLHRAGHVAVVHPGRADSPYRLLVLGITELKAHGLPVRLKRLLRGAGVIQGLLFGIAAELDEEPGVAVRQRLTIDG